MVRLLVPDSATLEAALAGDEALAAALGLAVVPGWASFRGALLAERDALTANPGRAEWGPRLFVAGEPGEVVGWGGFKGPPHDGAAEFGYEIAEPRRGRGLATAAARAMLAEAAADGRVRTVIAHTLPERNASTRVLEKLGFDLLGERLEGETTVWRFALSLPAQA